MAQIKISSTSNPAWVDEIIHGVLVPMVDDINPLLADGLVPSNLPEKVRKLLVTDKIEQGVWNIYATETADGMYEISVRTEGFMLNRYVSKTHKKLIHDFFEISGKLQNKGIAQKVLNASAKIADALDIKTISLHANLDVGGYAWLRKGFFPNNPSRFFKSMVGNKALQSELTDVIQGMTDAQLKKYVLTDDFRKYKDVFLGASWRGEIDLSDKTSRMAFTKSAAEASKRVIVKPKTLMTVNEQILDGMIRHQTYLLRYARNVTKDSAKLLKATETRVRASVLLYAEQYEGLPATSAKAQAIFKAMQKEITEIRSEAWAAIQETVPAEFAALAAIESAAMIKIIEAPFPISLGLQPLSAKHLAAIVNTQPFEGELLATWLKGNADTDISLITRNAKRAMIAGQTPTQVARAAMGTQALQYRDGEARKAFKKLESLYLTVTNGIGNQVKQDLYAANSDIIEEEYYVATLDIRTTYECAGHDGLVFPRGQGPIPPLHFRCRSLRIPYLNPENLHKRGFDSSSNREFLDKFAKENNLGTIRSYNDLPRGYKGAYNSWARKETRAKVGQVPALQNFDQFLRNQTDTFQNEYLGVGKADIFRQGKLKLNEFVTADGYELTIADLEKLSKTA